MEIISLELKNIRSYVSAKIEFSRGILLLSGDIGSGKTSVLHAIEFALFGIKRGEITGSSLLRHGKQKGSVKLHMRIDGKDVIIKRKLKKSRYGVQQDSGYIVVDDLRTEGTAEELKAMVIDILGYPRDILKKGKDYIYRYTVYTPQEQMKAILFERSEDRLDTLRKVFGIDKYKRIKENSLVYIQELKARRRQLLGYTSDLETKEKMRKEYKDKLATFEHDLENIKKKHAEIQEMLNLKTKDTETLEKNIRDMVKAEAEIRSIDERSSDINKRIGHLNKAILENTEIIKASDDIKIKDYGAQITKLKSELSDLSAEKSRLDAEISKLDTIIFSSRELITKVTGLDECPTCHQIVGKNHKKTIIKQENAKILAQKKEQEKIAGDLEKINNSIIRKEKELDVVSGLDKESAVAKEKLKRIKSAQESVRSAEKEISQNKLSLDKITARKKELVSMIDEKLKQRYDSAKKDLENIRAKEREIHNVLIEKKTRIDETVNLIKLYDKEIEEKRKFYERAKKTTVVQNWMEQFFINLATTMEKHVMARLYKEFNALFSDWFRMLIEDDTISVRLDDEFAPVVEQNGYDAALENLSGGEKTSVSLAYRLALNKVINDYVTHIKTRDLIILDEPTDGFSDQQLDKIRDVLEEINTTQIIIVSHETKIETIVDDIIRIEKKQHRSMVV